MLRYVRAFDFYKSLPFYQSIRTTSKVFNQRMLYKSRLMH